MTLLKGSDQNSREINVALLSLEADIKNKITNFDTSVIDKQLVEINNRIDKINAGDNNTSAQINDIRYEIEDINTKIKGNSAKIEDIEQKLSEIFSAENKVTDFNTTTNSGIYYWLDDAANKPGTDYGVLLVNKYDRGDNNSIWINQVAYGTNNKIYFRQNINSGSWTEWKAVAFEGEVNATLTVNGKTYNGSEAVDAGVQTVENGGTGATTAKDAFMSLANGLLEGAGPEDTEHIIFQNSSGKDWGLYKLSQFWEYIKGKISSVLGLTKDSYGGKASRASLLANYASKRLTSGNILPKDASEYGGMRKDVVTGIMTDSGRPGQDGHLLTMFWDSDGRWDAQLFLNCEKTPVLKARVKDNTADYGNWVDIITSANIGSQTVAKAGSAGNAGTADSLFYSHGNEINFKGGAQPQCWFNYRNADTEGPSPVNTMSYVFCNYSEDTSKSVIKAGSFNGTADRAVEVVDYGDTSRTVRIGLSGPGVGADKLLYLAGYTEIDSRSVKLKDVNKDELIKWLGIPRIKYADYQIPTQTFIQFQQVPIELSNFSSEVTPNNVLCFMVIYWTGIQLIASGDWGSSASSGLKCALIALGAGTGSAIIRCVYMV